MIIAATRGHKGQRRKSLDCWRSLWAKSLTAGTLPTKAALLTAVLVLPACVSPPPTSEPVLAAKPEPVKARPSAQEIRQRTISHLLARAEAAQREGRLTLPAGASAYDFYLNVQQLDADNRDAASGIQTIVLQLVDQARDALRQRAFKRVSRLLKTSEQLLPGNPLSAAVRTQLVRERNRATTDQELLGAQVITLPAAELTAKSVSTVALLTAIAQQLRAHNLRVVIIARNDAEGRWVYNQLRSAVSGYRVRGDIKLGNSPRLLLLKI